MSEPYKPVKWNKFKRGLDNYLWVGISTYLVLFTLASFVFTPTISLSILLMRAFGTAAFLLLNIILVIGPICRLNPMYLPLLYNRRHMGVSCFILALIHGILLVFTYHIGSEMHPIVSVFVSDSGSTIPEMPFQTFGAIALCILAIMAATSHDFWLRHLSPPVWKTLHMLVYVAYGLAVAYAVFGILQEERNIVFQGLLLASVSIVSILHFIAGLKEFFADFNTRMNSEDDFVETISVDEIPEKRAKIVLLHGERVAVFRYDGKISALSNVCQHQNGPLGEGKIVDGYVTSPWHGLQYRPQDGASPDPHTEKVPTFEVKIVDRKIWINHKPKLPGTYVEPAIIPDELEAPKPSNDEDDEFFIGWDKQVPIKQRRFLYNRLIGIFVFSFTVALLIPVLQNRYEPSFYRSMTESEFEGVFYSKPVPHLTVSRPGTIAENYQSVSNYLLVYPHKFGFPEEKSTELEGKSVKLKGSLIFNRKQTVIEVNPKSIEQVSFDEFELEKNTKIQLLGSYKLKGIIVNSKSYYGALNPGYGKPNRACSVRSIANGIPPLLLIQSEDGEKMELLVTGKDNEAIGPQILNKVEVPVSVSGDVYRWGDKYLIETEPRLIESLSEE